MFVFPSSTFQVLFFTPRGGLVLCRPERVCSCVHVACSCPSRVATPSRFGNRWRAPGGRRWGWPGGRRAAGERTSRPNLGLPSRVVGPLARTHVLMAFPGFMVTEFFSLVPPSQPSHPPRNGLKSLPNLLIRILKSLARVPSFPCSTQRCCSATY